MKTLDFRFDSAAHREKHLELLIEMARHQETPNTFEQEPILTGFRWLTFELARALAKIDDIEHRYSQFVESVNKRMNK